MTIEEFSNEFDVLVNSFSKKTDFGTSSSTLEFDEYEKSVFLTKAQENVIRNLYSGKNTYNDSFEKTEEIRRYLSSLVRTYTTNEVFLDYTGISENSVFFKIPNDVLFIVYESVNFTDDSLECLPTNHISVVPVTLDEYNRVKYNPFRYANSKRVLRIDCGRNQEDTNDVVELISKYSIDSYLIKYLSKPSPIILLDLSDGQTIDESGIKTECSLHPILHRIILEEAVKLALISRTQIKNNN